MENNQINITDSAVKKILSLTAKEDNEVKLRLSVSGGGCSGFQYGFSLDSEITPDDIIFNKNGANLVIDQISLEYLNGSEIDYENKLIESSFKINNPNAAASCGCGTSFSPKT
jgi:iron-sulfur cluster assembly accessory protein